MPRRLIYLLIIITTFTTCKKENDRPQWDVNVLGPLVHARLGFAQLIGDSTIEANADGSLVLNYDSVFSNFNVDSIYQIADTTIPTVVIFPPFPSTIIPGQSFFSNNNNVVLGLGNVQLKEAIISSGKIRLQIKNTLHSKVNFIYSIPHAKKNGLPFSVTASVDSASASDPKFVTKEYDFSGYDVDMTGTSGNSINTMSYNVVAYADSFGHNFNVAGLDTMVNLKTTLVSIQPYFVRGYLGQGETHSLTQDNTGIGDIIKNGTILLDSIQMNFDIINYIGADQQAYISYFHSRNERTGTNVDLAAPSLLQHYLNINRATINPAFTDSLIPSHYSVQLDITNSNIKNLIENLPDKIDFDTKINLNPLGNISGSNDFVYKDRLINTHLQIKMPLRFAANQLLLVDTVPFTISNATDFDPVGNMNFTLIADNGFPFDMNVQLLLLDSTETIVDSLLVPDYIAAAPFNTYYLATGITRTEIKIPVDANRKQKILSVKKMGIRMKLNTPGYPHKIQMYSAYHLDLKLIADGTYSIR